MSNKHIRQFQFSRPTQTSVVALAGICDIFAKVYVSFRRPHQRPLVCSPGWSPVLSAPPAVSVERRAGAVCFQVVLSRG